MWAMVMDEVATSEKDGRHFILFFVLVKLFAFMYSMMGGALVNCKIIGSFKIDIDEAGAQIEAYGKFARDSERRTC